MRQKLCQTLVVAAARQGTSPEIHLYPLVSREIPAVAIPPTVRRYSIIQRCTDAQHEERKGSWKGESRRKSPVSAEPGTKYAEE